MAFALALALGIGLIWVGVASASDGGQWIEFQVGRTDAGSSHVNISMPLNGGGGFQVLTPDQAHIGERPQAGEWFGVGSDTDRSCVWSGDLVPGSYYVYVQSPDAMPAISGEAVTRIHHVYHPPQPQEETFIAAASPPAAPAPMAAAPVVNAPPAPATMQPSAVAHMSPSDWMPMEAGAMHWFSFNVSSDDELDRYVTINLNGAPQMSGAFKILTANQADFGQKPELGGWLGAGTENDFEFSDYHWAGQLGAGTYYVVVEQNGATACQLSVTGEAVTDFRMASSHAVAAAPSPSVVVPPVSGPSFSAASVVAAPAPATVETATEPLMAMAPSDWMPMHPGQPHWFSFQVSSDPELSRYVNIELYGEPDGSGSLKILTGEQANFHETPAMGAWLGVGSENANTSGDYSWAGELGPATYFVLVEPNGANSCRLSVTGEAVTNFRMVDS